MSDSAQTVQKRVLIIDDSKFVRTTFKHIIRTSFLVREEADGEAGWRAIESDPTIVLVFSDLDMPRLDGYGLLQRIRKSADRRIRDLPVIVFSGSHNEKAEQRARTLGASDFISKSAEPGEVFDRIEKELRKASEKPESSTQSQRWEQMEESASTSFLTGQHLLGRARIEFAKARTGGTALSLLALRVESYAEIAQHLGKPIAERLISKIAKAIINMVTAESVVGRLADATFLVIGPAVTAHDMLVLGRRLQQQIANANVTSGQLTLKIRASSGVSAMGVDTAGCIEDLIKLAVQRTLVGPRPHPSGQVSPRPTSSPAEMGVQLSPGERAILRQIRDVSLHQGARVHDLSALVEGWPAAHRAAYRQAYDQLVAKGLLVPSTNGEAFSITNPALKALQTLP